MFSISLACTKGRRWDSFCFFFTFLYKFLLFVKYCFPEIVNIRHLLESWSLIDQFWFNSLRLFFFNSVTVQDSIRTSVCSKYCWYILLVNKFHYMVVWLSLREAFLNPTDIHSWDFLIRLYVNSKFQKRHWSGLLNRNNICKVDLVGQDTDPQQP